MKHTRILGILTIIFFNINAFSEPRVDQGLIKSIVLISAPNGSCGSGFIAKNGMIYTNAHVAKSVCHDINCPEIKISSTESIGSLANQEIKGLEIEIFKINEIFDYAILRNKSETALSGFIDSKVTKTDNESESIFSLGFPECKVLSYESGKILSKDNLRIFTNLKGTFGNSGSLIFNSAMQPLGIISQANSLISVLNSKIFKSNFSMRALPFELVINDSLLQERDSVEYSATQILNFYRQIVSRSSSGERLMSGMDFLIKTEALTKKILLNEDHIKSAKDLLLSGSNISEVLSLPNLERSNMHNISEQLFLAYKLETIGLNTRELKLEDPAKLRDLIEKSARSEEQKKNLLKLIDNYLNTKLPNFYGLIFKICFELILIVLFALIIDSLFFALLIFKLTGSIYTKLIKSFVLTFFLMLLELIIIYNMLFMLV